jgi:tetratricopeptide (TPR) repeat protein
MAAYKQTRDTVSMPPGNLMGKSALIFGLLFWAVSAAGATAPAPAGTHAAPVSAENQLVSQLAAAEAEKNWPKAETALQKLTALDPDRWEYREALADVQLTEGKYDTAIANYTSALVAAGKEKLDPRIKRAMAVMYNNEGNAYLKLRRGDDAVAAYDKAAALDPNPKLVYFNICVVLSNLRDVQRALPACDKAIAADPHKADTYFIKGSLLMGESSVDAAGKKQAPAGTAEALHKYLELAPTGPHASDVRQMLALLNGNSSG